MKYRQFDRLEHQIHGTGSASIMLRWKWGRLVLCNEEFTDPSGRLRWGAINELIAKAAARGWKLSRREVQYRVECARAYLTETEIAHVCAQFEYWGDLRSAGFPPVDAAENAASAPPEEPHDPRPPYEKRDAAMRQFKRIMDSPEAHGQEPLPGMRTWLPGFTVDTVGRDTLFRRAFEVHESIKATTPQLRQAADRAEREDREREENLHRLFDAIGRNPEASLGEAEDALLGAKSGAVR